MRSFLKNRIGSRARIRTLYSDAQERDIHCVIGDATESALIYHLWNFVDHKADDRVNIIPFSSIVTINFL